MVVTVPVVFNFFVRENTTLRVFEQIKKVKPQKLYLISDAGRDAAEMKRVEKLRERIFGMIDWECDIRRNFACENMGCRDRIVSGYNWVFESEEMAILLEDDTVPNESFFYYAQELLEKYKNDNRIAFISGNKLDQEFKIDESYTFSFFPSTWGWATWRRAWQLYDSSIEKWEKISHLEVFKFFYGKGLWENQASEYKKGFTGEVDTWDYQYASCRLANCQMGIVPKYNLIENIGFGGDDATHTTRAIDLDFSREMEIEFPLIHPSCVFPNVKLDEFHLKKLYSRQKKTIWKKW